jgi:hypothetical protein
LDTGSLRAKSLSSQWGYLVAAWKKSMQINPVHLKRKKKVKSNGLHNCIHIRRKASQSV